MRKSTKIISLILTVLMLVTALPITAFAAKQETYIKEMRISTASTADAAKKWLTDNGYTVVDTDLNQKTGRDYVYIGYKTTTNPDEAITDISLMQMDGGYSFSEYEAMVKEMEREIMETVDRLDTAVTEARANYTAGKQCAVGARNVLNRFKEDDSGKLLGDLLFVEPIDKSIITKIFLQGNSDITSLIYQMLAYACTDCESEDSWLDKLASVDVYEVENMLRESGQLSYYDDLATKMLSSFDTIQGTLEYYEQVCKPFDENYDPDEYENLDAVEKLDYSFPEKYSETVVVYSALSNCKYGNGTLKDFFMQDYNELDGDDFYPLFVTMTDGQRAVLPFVDYTFMIALAEHDSESAKEYEKTCIETFDFYEVDVVSVYTNVDRSLFEGGVALTNASLRKSASTGESPWYSDDNIDEDLGRALTLVAGGSFGAALGAVAVRCATKAAMKHTVSVATASAREIAVAFDKMAIQMLMQSCEAQGVVVPASVNTSTFRSFAAGIQSVLPEHSVIRNTMPYIRSGEVAIETAAENVMLTARYKMMQKVLTGVNVAMMISLGISLITEGIKIGIKVYNYYHPEYTDIPRIIVDEVLTDTDSYYVNYYAAKDQTDKSGDLNAWGAQRWQALYTTTDKKAGDPIIATSLVVKLKDSEFPSEDHGAVHYFGETAAANVNRYQFRKTATATYIFYERDRSLSMTASTFTTGQIVMFTGFGALGGVVIGGLGVYGAGKIKKKNEDAG